LVVVSVRPWLEQPDDDDDEDEDHEDADEVGAVCASRPVLLHAAAKTCETRAAATGELAACQWRVAERVGVNVARSCELLDDLDEVVGFVALGAGVVEQFSGAFDDGALLGGAGDGDAAAAAEFDEAFVAQFAECAQDGVGVDAEYGGEVFGGWESFARFGFAVGDGAADLAGDLFMKAEGVVAVEFDIPHGDSDDSFILMEASS
jgi:hypothetical protein